MLSNYTLYKRLEKMVDEKIKELNRDNFFNVGKALCPILMIYSFQSITIPGYKYLILFLLILFFLFCFKEIRNMVISFCSISLLIGRAYEIKEPKKVVNTFYSEYENHLTNLLFLKTIFNDIKANTFELYVLVSKNDLSTLGRTLLEIKRIIENKEYHKEINNLKILNKKYDNISSCLLKTIDIICTHYPQKEEIPPLIKNYIKDLEGLKFKLTSN